jgi:hypothetical protein
MGYCVDRPMKSIDDNDNACCCGMSLERTGTTVTEDGCGGDRCGGSSDEQLLMVSVVPSMDGIVESKEKVKL